MVLFASVDRWRRGAVGVAMLVGVSACGVAPDDAAPESAPSASGPEEMNTTITPRELADRAREGAKGVTSTRQDIRLVPPSDSACPSGTNHLIVVRSADGRRGWVDLDVDGEIDSVRDGDQLLVATHLVPEWSGTTPWVSVSTNASDPITRAMTGALQTGVAVGPLLADPGPASAVAQAEVITNEGPGRLIGLEPLGSVPASRYRFDDSASSGSRGARMDVWVDDRYRVVGLEAALPGQGGSGLDLTTAQFAYDVPVDVTLPAGSEVGTADGLPALPLLRDARLLHPACGDPEDSTIYDCVLQRAAGVSLAELAREDFIPFGCASERG